LAAPTEDEWLSEKLHVTVILRLILGKRRELERGEIVDLQGVTRGRFKDWRGLTRGLRSWIASDGSSNPPGDG
jgi:hypothetical protein